MARDLEPQLITEYQLKVFESALKQLTWPDLLTEKQLAAVRAELKAIAPFLRAHWIAEALEFESLMEPADCDQSKHMSMCRHTWQRLAAEYRSRRR